MGTNLLQIQSLVSKSPLSATFIFAKPYAKHSRIFPPRHQRSLRATPAASSTKTSSSDNNIPSGDSAKQPATTQPNAVEIRFRRRSRRRSRQQSEDGVGGNGKPVKTQASASASVPEAPPKKWEEMSMGEKAIELYVGEKGVLFWLNKFAYASIFIVIGGWILFRFVGPSLNLYQLDSAPLPPTSLFKGS